MDEYRRFFIEQLDIQAWAYSLMKIEREMISERDAYIQQMKLWLPYGSWELYHDKYMMDRYWRPTKTERIVHLLELGKSFSYIQKRLKTSPNKIRSVKSGKPSSYPMTQEFLVDGLISQYNQIRPMVLATVYGSFEP